MCNKRNKIVLSIISLLLSTCANIDLMVSTVEGSIGIDDQGFGVISDCNTGKEYKFGVMASVPYTKFIKEYEKLDINGSVLGIVSGKVIEEKSLVKSPEVKSMFNGVCNAKNT